ncbi:MAG: DUF4129 domain-containing protein [Steroidobacteraceae bacterium]|nr:DUF4129 domain-containing protein [Steroidobacteraceae bacterium]
MTSRRFAALVVLAALFVPLHAAAQDALAALDACIPKLDKRLDVGFERVSARCPDLAKVLEQSGWAAWLPPGWKESRNDLSAGSLAELRAVVARELETQPPRNVPDVKRLNEILTDLGATGQQRSGWWARFKKWVRSLFERRAETREEPWLDRLIRRVGLSQAVIEIITYIAMGAVVVLAALIILNELRAAGWIRARWRAKRGSGAANVQRGRSRLGWDDVERAPLADKPRLLLELIASRLTDLGRLPPAGAFTVRELVRAANLQEPQDRQRLNELALAAERARFAEEGVSPAMAEAAVEHGRALLDTLSMPHMSDAAAGAHA